MFKELAQMDHSQLKKVTIDGLSMVLEFKSGNKLEAKAPNQQVIDDFKEEMRKVLRADQLVIK